jgi:uncharacterized protein with HEPN domain
VRSNGAGAPRPPGPQRGGGGRGASRSDREDQYRFRDWRFRVRDMTRAVRAIGEYTAGQSYEQFIADPKTVDAVVRNLMTLGESVRWVPGPVQEAHPEIPWRTLRAVRNVVVHEYFGVDSRILWQTARGDLPPLVEKLETIVQNGA